MALVLGALAVDLEDVLLGQLLDLVLVVHLLQPHLVLHLVRELVDLGVETY